MKRSTDTSPESNKKNIPTQKNSDIFRLFFGVVVESAFAPLREMIFRKGAKEDRQSRAKIRGMSMPPKSEFRADSQRAPNPEPQKYKCPVELNDQPALKENTGGFWASATSSLALRILIAP
jgi:hypothetical protein